jgi:hypothetical protein
MATSGKGAIAGSKFKHLNLQRSAISAAIKGLAGPASPKRTIEPQRLFPERSSDSDTASGVAP